MGHINTGEAPFNRDWYRDRTTDYGVEIADTGTAEKLAGRPGFTLFIQRIDFYPSASAAQTYILRSTDDAIEVGRVPASAVVGVPISYDYGPIGRPLPEGVGLEAVIGGAGNGLQVHVEAYLRQTSPLTPAQL